MDLCTHILLILLIKLYIDVLICVCIKFSKNNKGVPRGLLYWCFYEGAAAPFCNILIWCWQYIYIALELYFHYIGLYCIFMCSENNKGLPCGPLPPYGAPHLLLDRFITANCRLFCRLYLYVLFLYLYFLLGLLAPFGAPLLHFNILSSMYHQCI